MKNLVWIEAMHAQCMDTCSRDIETGVMQYC